MPSDKFVAKGRHQRRGWSNTSPNQGTQIQSVQVSEIMQFVVKATENVQRCINENAASARILLRYFANSHEGKPKKNILVEWS